VAKALALRPRLLCIDELTLGLSQGAVHSVLDALRAVNRDGTTVLVVEQSLNTAAEVSRRAVFLEKGEVRFVGPTSDLTRRPDLARAVFLGGRPSVGAGQR
jgi:branched-chain amino acid transport system ATP-binding protein